MYEFNYDGHHWKIGQFDNGSWGFQQDDCIIRYTSQYEAELFASLMANSINR